MKKLLVWALLLSVSIVCVEFFPREAEAIPAFARKYKTACITCHATFPRMTALGEAFRLNGYKLPGEDELYVKDEPVSMGADAYKQVFPKAVWPSDIPGTPPIALRFIGDAVIDTGGTQQSRTNFELPEEIKILSAGSFGENMSFFVEFGFREGEVMIDAHRSSVTGTTDGGDPFTSEEEFVEEIEDVDLESGTKFSAWLMWEDLFEEFTGENHLNLRIGTIGMQDLTLPNTRGHNRITAEGYLHEDEMALHGHGSVNKGFELNGFGRSWRYNIGVLNGDRATSTKDYYGAFSVKLGGLGYDGSGGTTDEGGLKADPAGYWRDDSILFGFFAYRSYVGIDNDEMDRFGADLRWNFKDLSLAGGYIKGKKIGGGHGGGAPQDKDVWFSELEYFFFPWMQSYLRYEVLTIDEVEDEDKARFVVGTVLLARANVKINVEGRIYTKNEPLVAAAASEKNDEDRVVMRLDYAF